MNDIPSAVFASIDEEFADKPAATRRQMVAGAAGVIGSMGLMGLAPSIASASHDTDNQDILNIAATAEVLATIVNTVGPEKLGSNLDPITLQNIQAAAREELIHYDVLVSSDVGGKAATKRIWIPDSVFASKESLLKTLVTGDQIFINAYLIGTTSFGNDGNGRLARITAEFMGVEAVHRALALQSLGVLGNDRVFMKYSTGEENPNDAFFKKPGFRKITTAVDYLKMAGFGFGEAGQGPGAFYEFDQVRQRTPNPSTLTQRTPR
ncbi:MAG: ferritin-like domain-containing protein [Thermoleophilaceae bacterium]|nr:ferritin-like domain-containing protein [Thermoleophilaceae bacterium]